MLTWTFWGSRFWEVLLVASPLEVTDSGEVWAYSLGTSFAFPQYHFSHQWYMILLLRLSSKLCLTDSLSFYDSKKVLTKWKPYSINVIIATVRKLRSQVIFSSRLVLGHSLNVFNSIDCLLTCVGYQIVIFEFVLGWVDIKFIFNAILVLWRWTCRLAQFVHICRLYHCGRKLYLCIIGCVLGIQQSLVDSSLLCERWPWQDWCAQIKWLING